MIHRFRYAAVAISSIVIGVIAVASLQGAAAPLAALVILAIACATGAAIVLVDRPVRRR